MTANEDVRRVGVGPDLSELTPVEQLRGDSAEDTKLLREMAERARQYLTRHRWCGEVRRAWYGLGIGGVVGVFLLQIRPIEPEVDELLWVVVGDVPPAYLVTDDAETPIEALGAYVDEMNRWVEAVRANEPLDDVIPVNAPPTTNYVDALARRLNFIRREILREPPLQ